VCRWLGIRALEKPVCHCHIARTAEDRKFRTHSPDNVKSSITDFTHILYIGVMHTVNFKHRQHDTSTVYGIQHNFFDAEYVTGCT